MAILATVGLLAACTAQAGPAGPPGVSTGTMTGIVTNSLTGQPVDGVSVAVTPAVKPALTTTATGNYTADLPIGSYTVTYTKTGFTTSTQTVGLVAGQTTAKNVALAPAKPVAVDAGADVASNPGASVTLKATVTPLDGSTVTKVEWSQTAGVKATLATATSQSTAVTLGNAAGYRQHFLEGLRLLDRWGVAAVNPFDLDEGNVATFQVTVVTSSGTYKDSVNVSASLPYVVSLGIQDVPVGEPVLLNGKNQAAYQWSVAGPSGTKSTLSDANTRNPSFTPDVAGKYTLTEKSSGATLDVYAGTWAGGISGLDANGRPLTAGCTACHDGKTAPDKFTAWKASGHAEIFTQNINDPNGHWSISCAQCHTVGYDPNVTNGGFDEAMASEGWKVPSHGEVGYYAKMFTQFPKTAALANIQCESCHGPNNGTGLHPDNTIDSARVSLSAEVCGSCHGEPARHGRFQQWAESGHANAQLAIDESGSSSCARCHTAQGFMLWLKQGDLTKQLQGANGNATAAELAALGITKDTALPQTCATCHDPHQQGTISGEPTNATVRVVDETKLLPAGFQATEVGKGALCMTCHNTRNGIHNIDAPPTSYSAPHTAAQADVLMGENAYFTEVGERSPHSYLQDTCVTCHMEKTPPPAEFSYEGAGTNHAFKADITICSECHSPTMNGAALQAGVEAKLEDLGSAMSAYLLKKLPAQTTFKDYTPHTLGGKSYDVKSAAIVVAKDNIVSLEPTEPHGQQGFIVKLKTAVTVTYAPAGEAPHTASLTELEVQLGDITTDGTKSVIATTDPLVKAGWNFFLIEGDGSKGVHNPDFSMELLDGTIEALR